VVGVILAGGAGTRLWPIARPERPKQFVPLPGRRTPFQEAWRRLLPVAGRGNVVVVAGRPHLRWVHSQAPGIRPDRVLIEAAGRNTAASVAIAALWARERFGDAVMVVTPADHAIGPDGAFRTSVGRAVRAAARTGGLVTIGIPPRSPDPGFGYIRAGGATGVPGVRRAERFVEKPAAARARAMIKTGRWLWNSGIFVWRAGAILEEMDRHCPGVLRPLARWAARGAGARRDRRGWRVPAAVLRRVLAVPIDRAVLERSRRVLVARAGFRWSDLGNWAAVADLLEAGGGAAGGGGKRAGQGGAGAGRVLSAGARRCVGINEGGLTVFVGTDDLVAVRDGRTVLICRRDAAQRVREIAERVTGVGDRGRRRRGRSGA
jgi:mannose-1-phosphate guanylyltransferase/mannose-6-phosphate isomerase